MRELLMYFAGLPGLGLVKGGFVAQLCFGVAGCLDTHNITIHGLQPSTFAAHRFKGARTEKTKRKLVAHYVELCRALGGAGKLWDNWCQYVADKRPGIYNDADHVSKLHCEAIGV